MELTGPAHRYMYTQVHTNSPIKDQMIPWLRHTQRESFALPKLELSHCASLCLLCTSTQPSRVTLSAITFKPFLSTAPLSHEVCSSPALRGKELLGHTEGVTALHPRIFSTQRAESKQHSTSGPCASFKAGLAPGEAGGSPALCSDTHQRAQISSDGWRTQQQHRGTLHDPHSSNSQQ